MRMSITFSRLGRRGASVVEFALLAPLFVAILFGMLGYGQYFYVSHAVQQIANDAARATIEGLTTAERTALATASVAREGAAQGSLDARRLVTTVTDSNGVTVVAVQYDASNVAILSSGLLPFPDRTIVRRAQVRTGGIA